MSASQPSPIRSPRPTITRLIDGLERRGLVRRVTDTRDGRVQLVAATAAPGAQACLDLSLPVIYPMINRLLGEERRVAERITAHEHAHTDPLVRGPGRSSACPSARSSD